MKEPKPEIGIRKTFNTPVEYIGDYIERKFGSPVAETSKIENGVANEVHLIKTKSGQEFVARISLDEKNTRFESEQWALQHCQEIGVPVPKVLLVRKTRIGNKEYNLCLESKLPGKALYEVYDLSEAERDRLLNEAGQSLSKIHSVSVNGFGKFDKNGKGEFLTIQEILNDPYIGKEKIRKIAKEVGLDDEIIAKAFKIIQEESTSYPPTTPRLVHNDFMPKHILVEDKKVTGIIDFETAIGGDPIMDLAHWHFFFKDALNVNEIIKGYTNKEIFSKDFDRIFNLWRIYLGLMHLKFQYKENNQKGIDFAKTEITNDVNYYNSHLQKVVPPDHDDLDSFDMSEDKPVPPFDPRDLDSFDTSQDKAPAPLESDNLSRRNKKGLSRRNLLTGIFGAGGVVAAEILANKLRSVGVVSETTEIATVEESSNREIEETTAEEIRKCGEIIKKEQYAEIIKNPCLVSALYYSAEAVKKMAPPHKYRTEEIIWNIYPLITKQFRKNYINTLKRIAAEKDKDQRKLNGGRQSPPLDVVSFGKNLNENHQDAIDLFIKEGSPIYSMSAGIVVLGENHWTEDNDMSTSTHRGGNTIIVFNPADESFYRYAHMQETKIHTGTILLSGTQIGIVGHTGINASEKNHGEHLHFEINRYDRDNGIMIADNVLQLKRKLERIKS